MNVNANKQCLARFFLEKEIVDLGEVFIWLNKFLYTHFLIFRVQCILHYYAFNIVHACRCIIFFLLQLKSNSHLILIWLTSFLKI